MATQTADDNLRTDPAPGDATRFRPLRIWPVVILLVAMASTFVPDRIWKESQAAQTVRMLGPALGAILLLIWWMACSRARLVERLAVLAGIVGVFIGNLFLLDRSMVGLPTIVVTAPMGMAAFGIAALFCGNVLSWRRALLLLLAVGVGFGFSTLLRAGGVVGKSGSLILAWRFVPSPEQQLLAERTRTAANRGPDGDGSPLVPASAAGALENPQWPGFRGPDRSGTVRGTALAEDWNDRPPEKLWQIGVGPGWSSFAVAGDLLFTQEQRGNQEIVVCYSAVDGRELWSLAVESRFEDSIGGPGPRATPTIALADLFVQGASGHLMRIDARTGELRWQVDLRKVAQRDPPGWGFSGSPLVTDSLVIAHAGGEGDLGLLAFDAADGDLVWSAPSGDHSYSSPQICEIAGEPYVAMLTNAGLDLVDVASGTVRLAYPWKEQGYRCVQPRVVGESSLLLAGASGARLIRVSKQGDHFEAEEIWESNAIKPDYNDFVTYNDHAYGFDAAIFACVDLKTGERAWKQGRYGQGQVLLVADNGLLLVTGELGKLMLLRADPTGLVELGSIQALEGKTWNHPVLVGDRLYVRNSQQAACFRLPVQ